MKTHRTPLMEDWAAWEENWTLQFDASRHALGNAPYKLQFHLNRHSPPVPIDAKTERLPDIPAEERLTALEFEFFDLHYIRGHPLEECLKQLEISWWKVYKLRDAVNQKLARIVERD